MPKWVVVGANGMLGQEFSGLLNSEDSVFLSRSECDITDLENVSAAIKQGSYIINCAAYTAVDNAETHEEEAFAINAQGAENLARVCNLIGAKLIHISTDYVFPGDAHIPYSENAQTGPKSAYGRSKLAGEVAIQKNLPNAHYIVRTAWLYGQHGPNFVKTMIDLESKQDVISVVDDQFGQPTWTFDLANKVIELSRSDKRPGVYHGTSSGQTSWFGLTRKIFELLGADPSRVLPTTSADFVRPAPRPAFSVLGHDSWVKAKLKPIRDWESALESAFKDGAFS